MASGCDQFPQDWQRWVDSGNATFWACLEGIRCRVGRVCPPPPSRGKTRCKWNASTVFKFGRYLRHHARTGSMLIMTTDVVVKAAALPKMFKACLGNVQGRHTGPRAELMALVVLAEKRNAAGLYEARVDAPCLFSSIARRERAKRRINQDLLGQQAAMRHLCRARREEPLHSEGTGNWLIHTLRRGWQHFADEDGQHGVQTSGGAPRPTQPKRQMVRFGRS